jgi:hypothetical protein
MYEEQARKRYAGGILMNSLYPGPFYPKVFIIK